MSYGTDTTRPEAESSWRAPSGRPAPIRGCRIPCGGKMARRCRITSTFITLMGEHISSSSDGSKRCHSGETNVRSLPSVSICARGRTYVVRTYRHCLLANTRRSALILPQPLTALPSKPGGRTRWRAIVRFVRRNRSAIDLSRDSVRHALKIYLSFG